LRALDARLEMCQLGGAARAEAPTSEDRHAGTVLPCPLGTFLRR
jgi:hypothetical protein